MYFEKKEFTEMEAFMEGVSQTYGFEFHRYALSYKDGMQDLVVFHGIKVRPRQLPRLGFINTVAASFFCGFSFFFF